MKSVVYITLVVITTSCSSINYYGNGKLRKVRVHNENEIVHVSEKVTYTNPATYGENVNQLPPNSGEYFATDFAVSPAQEPEDVLSPSTFATNDQKVIQSFQHLPELDDYSENNEQPIKLASFNEEEKPSFAAIATFVFSLLGIILLGIGIFSLLRGMITSGLILLIVGAVSTILGVIFYLLAARSHTESQTEKMLMEFAGRVLFYIGCGILILAAATALTYFTIWLSNM